MLTVYVQVTLLQTFDDEWCVVGRDRFGEVEIGAVPSYVFTKGTRATFLLLPSPAHTKAYSQIRRKVPPPDAQHQLGRAS
jgi:hypothetical protein